MDLQYLCDTKMKCTSSYVTLMMASKCVSQNVTLFLKGYYREHFSQSELHTGLEVTFQLLYARSSHWNKDCFSLLPTLAYLIIMLAVCHFPLSLSECPDWPLEAEREPAERGNFSKCSRQTQSHISHAGLIPHLSLCGESPSESKESPYCRPGRWGSE